MLCFIQHITLLDMLTPSLILQCRGNLIQRLDCLLLELLSHAVRFVELLQNMVMRPFNLSQKFKPSEVKASHCYIFHDKSQGFFITRMKKVILVLFL